MYAGWQPDADFQRQAALWGIALAQPATPEELAAFTAYWQAEGKVFHHVQWQQKFARSLQINRASNNGQPKRDINAFSEPDKKSLMDSEVRNEKRRRPDETFAEDDARQREARLHHR